jgi:quinol-cytochrome oxidoreductase complex cytochrome b subunit
MDQSTLTVLVIAFLSLLAICVTVASIVILSGGKLYHKIPAKSRPRRWVIAIFFSYFVVFCVWFPVWFLYPHSAISNVLSFVFLAFTAFIAAWYVLGKVGALLSPLILAAIALVEWIKERSQRRDPPV